MPDSNITTEPSALFTPQRAQSAKRKTPRSETSSHSSAVSASSAVSIETVGRQSEAFCIPHSAFRIPHLALLVLSGAATLVAALAPVFKSAWVYFLFQAVCHQNLERSLWIAGAPMAVCARCFGIYAGALAALLASFPARRRALLAALLLLAADAASEWLGARPAWAAGRVATGFLAGAAAAPFLAQSMAEALEL